MYRIRLLSIFWIGAISASMNAAVARWPGKQSEWYGHARIDFAVDDRPCYVILPDEPAPGRPWVWRARFPHYHDEIDQLLVARGFHLARIDTDGMFGCDAALDHWDRFYDLLVRRHGLASRVVLEGVSRGGLFVYRWAARHPDRVECIYADTPVLDFKSWPLGGGEGLGAAAEWRQLLQHYGLTEQSALEYGGNPIDNLAPLAQMGIPIYHVISMTDRVVPPAENTLLMEKRYRALGGQMVVERIAQGTEESHGHHFPLADPQRPVDFILKHSFARLPGEKDYHVIRSGLNNCRIRFERDKVGRVVFLGGSITHMRGWRDLVCRALQLRFPETKFEFVDAGIPSTGSVPGAFRLVRDAFSGGPPDLLFEEAAVNDVTNRPDNPTQWRRGMEGIVRQVRRRSPQTDVVVLYFADPEKVNDYRQGRTPAVIAAHEQVCEHYGVPSIDLAREVTDRMAGEQFTWKDDFKNLHPAPYGHRLYTAAIQRLFDTCWGDELPDAADPHPLPAEPLDPFSYFDGHLAPLDSAELVRDWRLVPSWRPDIKAGVRPGFVDVPMLVADAPGATLSLPFRGRAVGAWGVAGPDAGRLGWSVDGKPFQSIDTFTRWSAGLFLPWTWVLEDELPDGDHVLTLRVGEPNREHPERRALRIVSFVVNG